MAGIRLLGVHRTWEDWAGISLGILIVLSPLLAGQYEPEAAMLNAAIVGVLVLALAAFELVDLHRSEEAGQLACGLWLIASPFTFGYADGGALMYWHFGLGAIVALLAAFELWQDWTLSDQDLARHGQ
jgi:hypothetical protein